MKALKSIADLCPDPRNANRGTKRGVELLEQSLERLGAGRSIVVDRNGVVIAGNKTLERAVDMGFEIKVVRSDGRKLVVVQREDLDLSAAEDARARELAIADNRVAQVGLDWNADHLLNAPGVELSRYFFDNELKAFQPKDTAHVEFDATTEASPAHECPKCGHQW